MQRISAYDRITNAVRQIVPDVMNTAAAMDAELQMYMANGTALPYLFCVPILIKDNMDATDGKLSVLCCCALHITVLLYCRQRSTPMSFDLAA